MARAVFARLRGTAGAPFSHGQSERQEASRGMPLMGAPDSPVSFCYSIFEHLSIFAHAHLVSHSLGWVCACRHR